MRKLPVLFFMLVWLTHQSYGQKFTAEKGEISFFSDAAIEDISAVNNMIGSLFNSSSGELVYIVKIKDFKFEKSLMREHFNEKYMETEKFPKSTFQGKVTGFKPNVPGPQPVKAIGKLNIHGVDKQVEIPGTLEISGGKVNLKSKFIVKLADYNIKIPTLVWQNIAEEIEVRVDFTYKPL
jgi:hypothetical protein